MTHINQRRDTAANWAAANPVLQLGERGFETDTRKAKTGDGVTAWNALGYEVSAIAGTKADIGLGAVNNTSDMDKPVSTAQQAALDALNTAKADKASPAFTGNPTAPTPPTTDSDTSLATTAFTQAVAALARAKRWTTGTAYNIGDVVGYGGGLYRATAAPTTSLPPALNTGAWEVVRHPDFDGWAQPDPYFASNSLSNTWQTFWKTGTVNSVAFTSSAGEFESGKRALKIDMAANSSQRLYPFPENIVKGGELIQIQVRAKLLVGTGTAYILGELQQNDETGAPEPLATGSVAAASMEGQQTLLSSWTTYNFTMSAALAKPRAIANVVVGGGTSGATIAIDWIKVRRLPDVVGVPSGGRAPEVWHQVGAASEPAFQNSWTNEGTANSPAKFIRSGRRVNLSGVVTHAAVINSTIFTLPVGYRPGVILRTVVYSGTGGNGFAVITIDTAGNVGVAAVGTNGATTYLALDNISFIAEG